MKKLHISLVKQLFTYCIFVLLITGCGGKGNDPNPEPEPEKKEPAKATLLFPDQNSVCTTGTIISTTQSSITFNWAASANTSGYEVNVKNLLTNTTVTQAVNTNQITISLLRNTPYSWYVLSKSSNTTTTAKSDTWKFYNSGPATISHSPFPADLIAPGFGQSIATASINLSWAGNDVDNDITVYDVYFGTSATPPLLKSNLTDSFLNNTPVTSGATYYWKIVTKDAQGNSSESDRFQFTVN